MKIKYFLCLFFAVHLGVAQVSYDIVKNDPDLGFFNANLDPWNVLVSKSRITFSGQAGAKFFVAGIFVNVSADLHYLDNLASTSDRIYGQSIYKDQNSRNINANLGYLFRWKKNGPVRFDLKNTRGTGGGTVTHYTNVDLDYNKYFGVEGGITSGYSYLTFKGDELKAHNYYTNSEVTIDESFTTYLRYTWLKFGFSYGKIINSEIKLTTYGNRTTSYMTRFYAHMLLPMSSELEDIFYTPDRGGATPLTYRYVLNGVVPLSTMGFSAGYELIPMKRIMGFGLEIGSLPGIKNEGNFYLKTKLSFNLNSRF